MPAGSDKTPTVLLGAAHHLLMRGRRAVGSPWFGGPWFSGQCFGSRCLRCRAHLADQREQAATFLVIEDAAPWQAGDELRLEVLLQVEPLARQLKVLDPAVGCAGLALGEPVLLEYVGD